MPKIDETTVLYLEDEPLVCMDTTYILKEMGFAEVTEAYTLAAATKVASSAKFGLAILDINVDRGQTSIELGKQLAAAGTPVIFASGNTSEPSIQTGGMIQWLDKPFSETTLSVAVTKILQV